MPHPSPATWKRRGLALALGPAVALLACGDGARPGGSSGGELSVEAQREAAWPGVLPDGAVELEDNPLATNYYVILDGSGSMRERDCTQRGTKVEDAKAALAEFVRAMPEDSNVGLFVFDDRGVSERVPLDAGNRAQFIERVNAVSANSGTPLKSAIAQGYQALTAQAQAQRGYGEYNLVIVTDGEASPGEDPSEIVEEILEHSPVVIHTIGFCIGTEHVLNQAGRTIYRAASNSEELRAGLGAVLAEAPAFDVSQF